MQRALKKIHSIILLIAILYAAIATWLISEYNYKYYLKIVDPREPVETVSQTMYQDLDKNGISEKISIYNLRRTEDTFHINIYKDSKSLINQWNINDSLLLRDIHIQDINNDNIDELIVWSQGRDSLFLTIIDITKTDKPDISETFILPGPSPNVHKNWDIRRLQVLHSDTRSQTLFFTIFSGHSLFPRGVFEFDLKKEMITNKYLFNAAVSFSKFFDINADGEDEIIISTSSTDNFPDSVAYSDVFSWLFIFNQSLDLLHSYKNEGKYGGIQFTPGYISKKPVLYIITTQNNRSSELAKMDKSFNIIGKKNLKDFSTDIIQIDKLGFIHLFQKDWVLYKKLIIDTNFVSVDSILYDSNFTISKTLDIDNDGHTNYYYNSSVEFSFLDESLTKITSFQFEKDEGLKKISLKKELNKNPRIAFNTTKYSYLTELVPSFIYAWMWPLFFLQIIIYHGFLFSIHLAINKIRTYTSFFLFTLHDSDNAIILINHNQKIISVNHKVEETLLLKNRVNRKQNYRESLRERNEVCDVIENGFKVNRQVKEEVSFSTSGKDFIGMVTVTPFISYFNFVNAYLVEIQDSTKQVVSERQQNWQRNVRRMVHDIKNPLGGVQLKLQTIYLKMLDESPLLAEKLEEEIEIANSEIKRIRNISKDFLKFSDLEIIQPEQIILKDFIITCVNDFRAFINEKMIISVDIYDVLPQVFWDKRQIELLLHIIIENAIDAIGGIGQIHVEVKLVQNLIIIKEKEMEINISDTGPGIKKENMDKVFEPNFSLKREGSGMGLVFAKQIVQQHSGSINILSNEKFKTIFSIKLPLKI